MKPIPETSTAHRSDNPSSSSKISFRPPKIRKLISKTPTTTTTTTITTTITTITTASITSLTPKITKPLSFESEIDLALNHLRGSDPLLASLIATHNSSPSFDSTHSHFLSLAKIILHQQLVTKAAKTIYTRFLNLFDGGESGVIPAAVLSLSWQQLGQVGVSGRKSSYLHDLADKFAKGILTDSSILEMNDHELLASLTAVKGIGVWSVHMFMIFSLHRPDVLPVVDLGVRKGVQVLYKLKTLPRPFEVEQICEKWRPYRSVGSWYMWRLIETKGSSNQKISKKVVAIT